MCFKLIIEFIYMSHYIIILFISINSNLKTNQIIIIIIILKINWHKKRAIRLFANKIYILSQS